MSLSTDVTPVQFSHTTHEEPVDYRAFGVPAEASDPGPAAQADEDRTLRTPFRAPAKAKSPRRSHHRR